MDNNSSSLISVIIPTCHRNDLLAKCLDCLAPGIQTFPSDQYEVIVTDDGSRSTAQQLVCNNYPWVRWTEGPHRGPATNRNHGAKLAKGNWLAFTDDDCLPSPGWLQAFACAVLPGIQVYEGKTTCEAGLHSPLEHSPINLTGGYLWSCNMMISADAFRNMAGFDGAFPHPHMEDTDFRERLKHHKYCFNFAKNALIDHPPRQVAWGARRGAAQESEVMWHYKSGASTPVAMRTLKRTLGFRLRSIKNSALSVDSLFAITSLCCELLYLCTKVHSWDLKYKAKYILS